MNGWIRWQKFLVLPTAWGDDPWSYYFAFFGGVGIPWARMWRPAQDDIFLEKLQLFVSFSYLPFFLREPSGIHFHGKKINSPCPFFFLPKKKWGLGCGSSHPLDGRVVWSLDLRQAGANPAPSPVASEATHHGTSLCGPQIPVWEFLQEMPWKVAFFFHERTTTVLEFIFYKMNLSFCLNKNTLKSPWKKYGCRFWVAPQAWTMKRCYFSSHFVGGGDAYWGCIRRTRWLKYVEMTGFASGWIWSGMSVDRSLWDHYIDDLDWFRWIDFVSQFNMTCSMNI